jgi:hypothetical protein
MTESLDELTYMIRALSKEGVEPEHGKNPSWGSHDGFFLGNFCLTPLTPLSARQYWISPDGVQTPMGEGTKGCGGKFGESDEITRNLFWGLLSYVIFPQNLEENR